MPMSWLPREKVALVAPPFVHPHEQATKQGPRIMEFTLVIEEKKVVIDEKGEHDLSPKTEADWEEIVSGAATLAEATNALMIPERARDPQWIVCVQRLAEAANQAYVAAEAHDLKTVSEVSDRLDGVCADCHRHYGLE